MLENKRMLRAHYETTVDALDFAEIWRPYAVELAMELFGDKVNCGDAFLRQPNWTERPPIEMVSALINDPELKEDMLPLAELMKTCPGRVYRMVWSAQSRICQPLMEEERCTYIGNQHGRLLCLMGLEFWDPRRQESRILWNPIENRAMEDPYELDLTTLSTLSDVCRVIPHGFVRSYSFFYVMHPYEKTRLQRIAALKTRLDLAQYLSQEDLLDLFSGHDEFIEHWAPLDELQFL